MYKKSYRKCTHCNKEIISSRHKDHESKCLRIQEFEKLRPGKVGHPKGKPAWNKGLNKHIDDRVRKNGESVSKTQQLQIATGTYVPRLNGEEARAKTSERMSLHNPGGRTKWYKVNGISVQGTYERDFALALENQLIKWEKIKTNNHLFKYEKNGKIKSYAPDIFIPSMNLYVEIKGYWWGDDENKMKLVKEQHEDKNVIILFGRKKLDFIIEDIKKNLPLEPVWSW